jgi:pimeloyl-ACP methyl ester carboxylesterase
MNVTKSFADDNLERFKDQIERAKKIGSDTSGEGIIAALNAMKLRKDRTFIIEKFMSPVLFVVGKKDNYIPVEKLMQLSNLPNKKYIVVLENSGHMGFIEEKEFALDEVENFLDLCFM